MKNDKLYLQHILECIDNIKSYILNGESDFFSSKLTHNYFGVDNEIVWNGVKNELPLLKDKIADLLNHV